VQLREVLATTLSVLLANLGCLASSTSHTQVNKSAEAAAKVKSAILKLGTGPAAHVELKLQSGTRLKGYVLEAQDTNFVVIEEKTGEARELLYP